MPQISFAIADPSGPEIAVQMGDAHWSQPLPTGPGSKGDAPSYGDFFNVARTFLEDRNYRHLTAAFEQQCGQPINPSDIQGIRICIEKHGAFYHPARIDMDVATMRVQFVLNTAFSGPGLARLKDEFRLLRRLAGMVAPSYVPRVYAMAESIYGKERKAAMMLGEWFGGYCEFHLVRREQGSVGMLVWDPGRGNYFLTREQIRQVYHNASLILTRYYNVGSGEQIYPWHHAAGDFVLKNEGGHLFLKLITVRQYASMMGLPDHEPETLMQALLVFFMNMTIRMRLDREQGVGETLWAHDLCLEGVTEGFLEGLTGYATPEHWGSGTVPERFHAYLLEWKENDYNEMAESIVNAYDPRAPEVALIRRQLGDHVGSVRRVLTKAMGSESPTHYI